MSLEVTYRRAAKKDLVLAAEWYDQQRSGLGHSFLIAVRDLIDQIKHQQTAHAVVVGDVRQAMVPKFPYSVLYLIRRHRVVVIAVFHSSRDPAVWRSRI